MNYELDFFGITMIVNVYMGSPATREEPGEDGYLEDVTLIFEGKEVPIENIPQELEEWIGDAVYEIERKKDEEHAAAYEDHIDAIKDGEL